MTQITFTFLSKSESLLGLMIDQGEYEIKKETWVPFTRLRIGLFLITADIAWYRTK